MMTFLTNKKSRGRPPLDEAVKVRREWWRQEVVKAAESHQLSEYRMDYLFDIHHEERMREGSYDKRRRKLFGDLKDKSLLPFGKDAEKFIDLVCEYQDEEGSKIFGHTRQIYYSYIWPLFHSVEMNTEDVVRLIVKIFMRHGGFLRINTTKNAQQTFATTPLNEEERTLLSARLGSPPVTSENRFSLILPLRLIPWQLDRLALLGAALRVHAVDTMSAEYEFLIGVYKNQLHLILDSINEFPILRDSLQKVAIERIGGAYEHSSVSLIDIIAQEAEAIGLDSSEIDFEGGQSFHWIEDWILDY